MSTPLPHLTKTELRQRFAQLRAIISEWDPIGVMGDPEWPRDEYDCIVGPLMKLLEHGCSEAQVIAYLRGEIAGHFGMDPAGCDLDEVARRARNWFGQSWASAAELVTIYVALLDEGTSVWRPVLARPLPSSAYRIVGLPGTPSDERWQFPVGAVVRCEERRFAGEDLQLVAVATVVDTV